MPGLIQDYKIRKQIDKNADVEAEKIYDKLNKKTGDYDSTAYAANQNTGKGNFRGVKGALKFVGATASNLATAIVKGNAYKAKVAQSRRIGVRQMKTQVKNTRRRQYNEAQKKVAEKMGVNL